MSTFREENVRYLRPLWIRALVIYAVILAVIAFSVINWPGDLDEAWPLAVGVAVGLTVVFVRRRRRRSTSRDALALSSADAAARKLFGEYVNTPGRAVVPLVVTGTAQLHVIYGNFARCEEMLATIAWDKEPPFIRGDSLFVQALAQHVQGHHAAAVALTATMMPMMEIPKVFPGSARLGRSIAMLEDLGRLLASDDREAAVRLADPRLTRSSRLHRGVVAWALAQAEERWGNAEASKRWLAESRSILPHAYGLGVPRPPSATPVTQATDPANPYAAPSVQAVDERPFDARPSQASFWRRHRYVWVGLWLLVLVAAHTYLSCSGRRS